MFTLCELCVFLCFTFYKIVPAYLQCVFLRRFFSLIRPFRPIYVYFLFFCLLAYTIIQRKSETVDFNDFTFCNFYLLACFSSSSQFFAYKRCSLFTTIATDLEFLQYDLFPVLFFVLNFDESNTSARAPNAPRGAATCMCVCVFLLNLQIGKTQF